MVAAKAVCQCQNALFCSGCLDDCEVNSPDRVFRLMSEKDARRCYVDVQDRSRVRSHLVEKCKSIEKWREVCAFVVVVYLLCR
jgi:hypothetical protein